MKHRAITYFLLFALMLTMTGCSAANTISKLDAAENRIEEKMNAAEDSVERAVRRAVTPSAATMEPADTTITQTQAENIALEFAGFTATQVNRLRTEYEIDDGIPQYNVEFHEGDWEYEFEIDAKTGKILCYDKDHKYD